MKSARLILLLAVCASLCLCHVATARMLQSAAREAILSGFCFTSTDTASIQSEDDDYIELETLREKYVKYNTKKSMYRDGDIIAVLTLRDAEKNLAACANACLLDWRLDDDGEPHDTPQYDGASNTINPSSTHGITATRECEAFNFNVDTGACYLISGQTSSQLTRSDNFWSGKIVCQDISSVDDWAAQVVA